VARVPPDTVVEIDAGIVERPEAAEVRPPGAEVSDETAAAGERVKEAARDAARRTTERAAARASEQKNYVAGQAEQVARALKRTAGSLRDEGQHPIAGYAERAAERIDDLSSSMREQDLGTLVRRVESFARREPGLFLGGSIALGVVVARFLKSSPTSERA
jgi:hypothetical protein